MSMLESEEFGRGDTAQREWAKRLALQGRCVLPAYAFQDVVPETKAPVMLIPGGLAITPDVLALGPKGASWHEVKSKSVPSWRRLPPGPRWEHGFDYSLLQEYADVQSRTRVPVFIALFEMRTPQNLKYESILIPSAVWLYAALDTIKSRGEHRPDWPKRNGNPSDKGRKGMGGWLWPRSCMSIMK